MLGLAAVPSIVMFFGCIVLPESPRWLVSKGFCDRAKIVLEKIRGTEDVSVELEDIKMVCDEEEALLKESKCDGLFFSLLHFFRHPSYINAFNVFRPHTFGDRLRNVLLSMRIAQRT